MSEGPGEASTALLAVDTGGTFTDLVLLEGGRPLRALKVPSTPHDPAEAVLTGIGRLLGEGRVGRTAGVGEGDAPGRRRFHLLHGSTVATNALLERRGARVVLITNEGFEDVIEIGRQNRPQLYALVGHRPPPLVAREHRLGVRGRLGPAGEEIEPLDATELETLAERVRALGAEAVAVSLLHAYAEPGHERAVAAALQGAGVPLSISSEILPEFREYERTSTTVVNAFVSPVVDRYLERLAREAGADRITIMGSNGGALPVERARREPVHTVLSGPAGGVMGALAWARRAGHDHIVTFDMGGTSTDVSLCPGRPLRTREMEIDRQPVAIPVIDIHTVGAGGGSIARVDAGGALRVGPESAGASPGPICYGRGGTEVTVTDAHVWLGRLPVDGFLGGSAMLDREAVRGPLTRLAEGLGTTPDMAAQGVLMVADTAMERALRVISVERGYDPIDFAVVAFGGAGGLHVAELASRLGASRAIVPPDPGLLSAYGMLAAPMTHEASRTVFISDADADADVRLSDAMERLEAATHRSMGTAERSIGAAGPDGGAHEPGASVHRWIDARYRGQSFELAVPADGWVERFHQAHGSRYGYRRDDTPVEAVTVRVVIERAAPALPVQELLAAAGPAPTAEIRVVHEGADLPALRVHRAELGAGHRLDGPLVVQEYSGTTWVPPGWAVEVDRWGCLHLTGLDAPTRRPS